MVDDSDPARRVRDSTISEKSFLSFLLVF